MVTANTTPFTNTITTVDQLREFIPPPSGPAVAKEIDHIDEHARAFIERAPFALIATSNAEGKCDVPPKGDVPGFVQVLDDHTRHPRSPRQPARRLLQNILPIPTSACS
jgi:predicted pyridoxine 5'-phosphate oxidase superfamily flavin-nucleotide-binding protein